MMKISYIALGGFIVILLIIVLQYFSADNTFLLLDRHLDLPENQFGQQLPDNAPLLLITNSYTEEGVRVPGYIILDGQVICDTDLALAGKSRQIDPLLKQMNSVAETEKATEKANPGDKNSLFEGCVLIAIDRNSSLELLLRVMYTCGKADFSQMLFVCTQKDSGYLNYYQFNLTNTGNVSPKIGKRINKGFSKDEPIVSEISDALDEINSKSTLARLGKSINRKKSFGSKGMLAIIGARGGVSSLGDWGESGGANLDSQAGSFGGVSMCNQGNSSSVHSENLSHGGHVSASGPTGMSGIGAGGLNRKSSDIYKVVSRITGSAKTKYETRLRSNPSLKGNITIRFIINKDGSVTGSSIASNTTSDPSFGNDIMTLIQRLNFGPTDKGDTTVVYPLTFSKEKDYTPNKSTGSGVGKNNKEEKITASVLKLTILMSKSGIRLAGGDCILSLRPKVINPETGEQFYHFYPLPGEENLTLEQRQDLFGMLLLLRKMIDENPNFKEDTVIIACDTNILLRDIIAVVDICHNPEIGFTNIMFTPGFVGE